MHFDQNKPNPNGFHQPCISNRKDAILRYVAFWLLPGTAYGRARIPTRRHGAQVGETGGGIGETRGVVGETEGGGAGSGV